MITLARAIRRATASGASMETLGDIRHTYYKNRIKMREKLAIEASNKGKHRRSKSRRKADKGHSVVPDKKKK